MINKGHDKTMDAQDDLCLGILPMLRDTFSLDVANV